MRFRLIMDKSKDEEIVAHVHTRSQLTDQIEALVMTYTGSDQITAYREEEFTILRFPQIECISVLDGKTYAIDIHGTQYLLKYRLYELEQILPASFIRINKSSLANEAYLVRFTVSYNGAVNAEFRCGYTEYVSRRCFAVIKRRFDAK